jgi:hypothetical protein
VRIGKIARLPSALREEINERLLEGRTFADILSWLNALPEVAEVLKKHFDGAPITEVNLSRWRAGGYVTWLENKQVKEAIENTAGACREVCPEEREALTANLALMVTARMTVELRKFDLMPEGPPKSAAWRELVWALTLLRRGEFYHEKMLAARENWRPNKSRRPRRNRWAMKS